VLDSVGDVQKRTTPQSFIRSITKGRMVISNPEEVDFVLIFRQGKN
jgi:hypothetical protein